MAEYIAHVRERIEAARQEMQDVVQRRAEKFVRYVEGVDIAAIVADTDEAKLTAALDEARNNLGYGNVVLQTLDTAPFMAAIRPEVVAANTKLADAATRTILLEVELQRGSRHLC